MATSVKDLSVDELRSMIEDTVRRTMEDYLEDLQALSSPAYVQSITEAREDFRAGRTVSLEEVLKGLDG
jgi:PHD/YefM family antitoxin component YafN of YafNO toxin-antitoxin module